MSNATQIKKQNAQRGSNIFYAVLMAFPVIQFFTSA